MENININLGGFIGLVVGFVLMGILFAVSHEPGAESIPPRVITTSAILVLSCIFGGNSAWQAAFANEKTKSE